MKYTYLLAVLIVCTLICAGGPSSSAQTSSPQAPNRISDKQLNKVISLHVNGNPAKQVFAYLEKTSGISFRFSQEAEKLLDAEVTLASSRIRFISAVKIICGLIGAEAAVKETVIEISALPKTEEKIPDGKDNKPALYINGSLVTEKEVKDKIAVYLSDIGKKPDNPELVIKVKKAVLKRIILLKVRDQFIEKNLTDQKVNKKEIKTKLNELKEKIENTPTLNDLQDY
jgi:hypothetical protein